MPQDWITRWRHQVSAKPVRPGIWKRKGGGFVVHAQVRDPSRPTPPGERPWYKVIFRVLREARTAKEAFEWLTAERERVSETWSPVLGIPLWKDFAVALLERKVRTSEIESAGCINKSKRSIARIIETAPWAELPVTEVRHEHLKEWRDRLPTLSWKLEQKLESGQTRVFRKGDRYTLGTLTGWLSTARVIWREATIRFKLPCNPMDGIRSYSASTAKPDTAEHANSLNPRTEVPTFLALLKKTYPRWYAFAIMGFVTGQPPSALRPIRRTGRDADIDLAAKKLYIRRSNAHLQSVTERKPGDELVLTLPDALVKILKEHIADIEASRIGRKTDLLFPNPWTGRMLSKQCLAIAFRDVLKEMGLNDRKLALRSMRRIYESLAEEAKLGQTIAMLISGRKMATMKANYSAVRDKEVAKAIGKLLELAITGKIASDTGEVTKRIVNGESAGRAKPSTPASS